MNIQAILHLFFGLLCGIGIIIFVNNTYKINKSKNILVNLTKKEVITDNIVDKFLNKMSFVIKSEKNYSRIIGLIQSKRTPRFYTKIGILFILLAVLFSVYMRNIYISIPLIIVGYQVPSYILEIKLNSRIKKYDKQILNFLQSFITEYTTLKSVPTTLVKILPTLSSPLKPQIDLLVNELNSGISPNEAFSSLSERSSNKNLLIYSQLMIMHYQYGSPFVDEISKTIQNMRDETLTKEENSTELSMVRLANIILNLSIPLFYMILKSINPQDTLVFVNTSQGKKIIFLVVCTSLFSLFMGNKMSKIKI